MISSFALHGPLIVPVGVCGRPQIIAKWSGPLKKENHTNIDNKDVLGNMVPSWVYSKLLCQPERGIQGKDGDRGAGK